MLFYACGLWENESASWKEGEKNEKILQMEINEFEEKSSMTRNVVELLILS